MLWDLGALAVSGLFADLALPRTSELPSVFRKWDKVKALPPE